MALLARFTFSFCCALQCRDFFGIREVDNFSLMSCATQRTEAGFGWNAKGQDTNEEDGDATEGLVLGRLLWKPTP